MNTGGNVVLSPGQFQIRGNILMGSGSVSGQGPEQTVLVFSNRAHLYANTTATQTIEGFSFSGAGYPTKDWHGVITVQGPNKTLKNLVGTADNTIQAVYLFLTNPDIGHPIKNIRVENCHAVDANTYGFVHSQWYYQDPPFEPVNEYSTHTDIFYKDCTAKRLGSATGFNPWITGFDFAEMNHIKNLLVQNCVAEEIWESGFHFEYDPVKINCVIEDCVSIRNGRKPYVANPVIGTTYFGSGYYAPKGDVTHRRCYSEENSWYGFIVNMGGKVYDCVDVRCGKPSITAQQRNKYRPASFASIPSRITNPNFVLERCSSFESRGFALHSDLANKIQIKDFVAVDPVGINGTAICLGCTHGQFDDASVSFSGWSELDTFIAANANENVTYTGFVVTSKPAPIKVSGAGSRSVRLQDISVYSNAALQGTNGVVVSSDVPSAQVTLSNVVKKSPTLAPEKPVAPSPGGGGDPGSEHIVITSVSKADPLNPTPGAIVKIDVTFTNVTGAPGTIEVSTDRPCQIPMPDGSVESNQALFDVPAMSPGESSTWRFWIVPQVSGAIRVCFSPPDSA